MTNRSSHMPVLTTSATTNSSGVLRRTRFSHKICGITMLVAMSAQNAGQYGPVIRFQYMNRSYSSPLYQAMNASML